MAALRAPFRSGSARSARLKAGSPRSCMQCRDASLSPPASGWRIRRSCTPSRRAGAEIDVFTLDTGRLFPETLETLAESERRYGLRIRVVAPDAGELEETRGARRRAGLSPFPRGAQGLLRCAQGAPARACARGCRGLDHRARRGQSAGRAEVPFAVLGRRLRPDQDQPDRRLERGAARRLHRRQRHAGQSAARARLSLDRLPALHARDPARRGHPRGTLVVGERRRQGMRTARAAGAPRRELPHEQSR